MADETGKIDSNNKVVAMAVTDDSNKFIKMLRIDDATKGLKVSIVGGIGTGTVTSVSVTSANGVSGVVATATTTPAITLTLGAITPTSVNGNTFTTGTYTLTGQAGKTLTFNGSVTLTGTDSQTYTFPTTSATIARTDAANTFTGIQTFSTPIATGSVATMSATVGGGVPTPPNNTTTFLRGDGTFAAPTSSVTPSMIMTNVFDSDATGTILKRISTPYGVSSLTATGAAGGMTLGTTASSGQFIAGSWQLYNNTSNTNIYLGSPTFSVTVSKNTVTTGGSEAGSSFFGLGAPTVSGAGHTYTSRHIGFKILTVAGNTFLYATQGDATTETASSPLVTVAYGDNLDLIFKVNGTSSVDYYWRKNGGALSSATNLTTNIPSSTSDYFALFSVANDSTTSNQDYGVSSASYSR